MPIQREEKEFLLSTTDGHYCKEQQHQFERHRNPWIRNPLSWTSLVSLLLTISITLNVWSWVNNKACSLYDTGSHFLGTNTIRNVTFDNAMSRRGWKSTFNMSENDELWGSIAISPGMVTLEHSLTDAMSLPRGHVFPWDSDKSVYILDSHHNLHCLKALYNYITESERGQEHSADYWHMVHCLDEVRRGIICNAGNVIRYTQAPPKWTAPIASGHINQCVDFDALEQWTRANSACYHYTHMNDSTWTHADRMKDCPPESPYLVKVREHFNLGSDWTTKYGSWEDEW